MVVTLALYRAVWPNQQGHPVLSARSMDTIISEEFLKLSTWRRFKQNIVKLCTNIFDFFSGSLEDTSVFGFGVKTNIVTVRSTRNSFNSPKKL